MTNEVAAREREAPAPAPAWSFRDLAIAVALFAAAFVLRFHFFPRNGLFHDDAWAAASVSLAAPAEWWRTSVEHPGFTLLLSPLRWAARDQPTVLVYPVLVAGALAPAVVYGFLRMLAYARSISCALAALVVVAPGAIAHSDNLKKYVIDLNVVAFLAATLPRIAARQWSARFAVAWVIGALALTTFSAFALIATAVAGVVLVVQANDDRRTRVLAIAAQVFMQLVYFYVISQTYSDRRLDAFWSSHGGYIDLRANPFAVAADTFAHLRGVVKTFPVGWAGGSWLRALLAVAAIAGLVLASVRRRGTAARFLLLLVTVAAAASALHLLPFGTNRDSYLGRLNLWLIPAIALGLAEILRIGWRATATRPRVRTAFNVVLYAFAIVVIAASFGSVPANVYGSRSATEFVDAQLGPHDLLVLMPRSVYSFGIETGQPVTLEPDTSSAFGSRLEFDSRVIQFENLVAPDVRAQLDDTDRVIVMTGVYTKPMLAAAAPVLAELEAAGFRPTVERMFDQIRVTIYERR